MDRARRRHWIILAVITAVLTVVGIAGPPVMGRRWQLDTLDGEPPLTFTAQ